MLDIVRIDLIAHPGLIVPAMVLILAMLATQVTQAALATAVIAVEAILATVAVAIQTILITQT